MLSRIFMNPLNFWRKKMVSTVQVKEVLVYCSVNKVSSENTNSPIMRVDSFLGRIDCEYAHKESLLVVLDELVNKL